MKKTLLYLLLCFAAGGFSALAMAPHNLWPVLFVTLGGFYFLLAGSQTGKAALLRGWAFGFGYFLFGLSWIGNALLVQGNDFAWAWPLAVSGLPFALAFFYGFAALASYKLSNLKTVTGYITFAAVFALTEWLRGHIFTGFPWNLFGYSWAEILPIVQVTSFGSVYLLTWLTVLWCAIGGFLFVQDQPLAKKIILPLILTASFAAVYSFGQSRIESYALSYDERVVIKIVQPNIPQHEKWDRAKMNENFFTLLRLSYPDEVMPATPTYIAWPETAMNYVYIDDETSMNLIRQMLSSYENGAYLITGLLRRTDDGGYGNSIVMIDENGAISNVYDKHHLVPFGEYIPFQKWLPFGPIVDFSGFERGAGLQNFSTPEGISYSPLVCYEGIFPNAVLDNTGGRPDFILNATNDAWYGDSAGPYQHLTQTVFRAVEEGTPFLRVANTGVSALIAATGDIIEQIPLQKRGNRVVKLPNTHFLKGLGAVSKNTFFFIMVFASLGFAQIARIILETED